MQSVGIQRILFPRAEKDAVKDGDVGGRERDVADVAFPRNKQFHLPRTAAESFLLAAHFRAVRTDQVGVAVLGTGLVREQDHLFGADALGVDIDHQLQADLFQVVQPEIRHFDAPLFLIRQRDVRPLEGISVTGFDDTYHSAHSTPPLTTMRQPFYAMGQTAAEMLCDRIANGRRVISKVYLETKLIERESVLRLR